MVCVPCILLPVLAVIYVRFIQPLILRFVPERWKAKVESILYPTATCPINVKNRSRPAATRDGDANGSTCAETTPTETAREEACPANAKKVN